jgi:phage baseplate assembly protein V
MMKELNSIARKVRLLLGLGIAKRTDDSGRLQRLQVSLLTDEVRDDLNRYQNYGFASRPLPGAEAVVGAIGGSRNHLIVLVIEDGRHRKRNLEEGESAMYTDEGDYIHMKRGRIVEVFAGAKLKVTSPEVEVIAETKVTLQTPVCEISGDLNVGGNATVQGTVQGAEVQTQAGVKLGTHPHGGVQPGGGQSGGPIPS